jgi:hypothetical protein
MTSHSVAVPVEPSQPYPQMTHSVAGMVDQRTLAAAFASAGWWLYPTSFEETSCITAMKAQALGTPRIVGIGLCKHHLSACGVGLDRR